MPLRTIPQLPFHIYYRGKLPASEAFDIRFSNRAPSHVNYAPQKLFQSTKFRANNQIEWI